MKTSTEPDDPELARRAAAGDDRAYVLLIRRRKDHLQRLLLRYLGDPVEAGEAVQEAFVAAWSALGRYDPNRPFGAWLRTIAINKAKDRGRRMAVRRMIFGNRALDEGGVYQHPDPQPDAKAVLVERERLAILDRAISRLPAPPEGGPAAHGDRRLLPAGSREHPGRHGQGDRNPRLPRPQATCRAYEPFRCDRLLIQWTRTPALAAACARAARRSHKAAQVVGYGHRALRRHVSAARVARRQTPQTR